MMNRLAGLAVSVLLVLVLCSFSADVASAASCCISETDTCQVGAACTTFETDRGLCSNAAFLKDCGGPLYCPFDQALGCLTANQCSAAKLRAAGQAVRATLGCDMSADAKGIAVDPACTAKALATLPGAFSLADASGPCPGNAATVQNDISQFESNANTAVGNAAATRRASRCDAQRIAAMGKEAARMLGCESKAAMIGIDPYICDLAADERFQGAIYRAYKGGTDCSDSTPHDELDNEAVYPFVTTVVDHLAN